MGNEAVRAALDHIWTSLELWGQPLARWVASLWQFGTTQERREITSTD